MACARPPWMQVAKHNSHDSAWFVHEGKVYDATPFLEDHPGGADSILIATGADATEDFNAIHSNKVSHKAGPCAVALVRTECEAHKTAGVAGVCCGNASSMVKIGRVK